MDISSLVKPTHKRDISKVVEESFEQNCSSVAVSSQSIVLSGLKFTASDGCTASFMNKATSIAECSIDSVIESIATEIAETDSELAKRVADAETVKKSDTHTSVTLKERLSSKLSHTCSSIANASQYFKMEDSEVICNSGSTLLFGNSADVRATCIVSMIQRRVAPPGPAPSEGPVTAPPAQAPAPAEGGSFDVALVVGISVFAVLIVSLLVMVMWLMSRG